MATHYIGEAFARLKHLEEENKRLKEDNAALKEKLAGK